MIDLNQYSAEFDKRKIFSTGGFAGTDPLAAVPNARKGAGVRRVRSAGVVGRYGDSQLGAKRNSAIRARAIDEMERDTPQIRAGASRQGFNAQSGVKRPIGGGGAPAPRFKEPQGRGYSPYS